MKSIASISFDPSTLIARLSVGFVQTGPEHDALEPAPADAEAPDLDGDLLLHLTYADAKGAPSQRVITAQRAAMRQGELYLGGFCHLRGADRMFRADRILTLANGRTGEIIADPLAFIAHLAQVAYPLTGDAPIMPAARPLPIYAKRDKLRKATRPLAVLMMALAQSDRAFVEAERAVLRAMIEQIASTIPRTNAADKASLEEEYFALVPNGNHVARAARAILQGKADPAAIPRWCRLMIEADGITQPEEVTMFRQIVDTVARRKVEGWGRQSDDPDPGRHLRNWRERTAIGLAETQPDATLPHYPVSE